MPVLAAAWLHADEVGEATAGRSIDLLAEACWVERRTDASDRRSYKVFPTDALSPIIDRLAAIGSEEKSAALMGFTSQESDIPPDSRPDFTQPRGLVGLPARACT
ncbi:MAG: hypothetical protein Q8R44_05400 [Novosphingobium sp.]|nr:hypothetical protein [Novosphingobium sp.]